MARGYYLPGNGNYVSLLWKRHIKRFEPLPLFPRVIQIQTQSGCNASCSFCPNDKTINRLTHGTMEMEVFKRIIDEAVFRRVKRISPYLMNEPLIDRKIAEKIKYISGVKKEPTVTKINTNASHLDEEMALKILDSGLDRISISFHGITKSSYEKSMKGLSFEKNLKNVERFVDLKAKKNVIKPRIRITMVHTNIVDNEIEEIRRFWNSKGLKVNVHALENRTNQKVYKSNLSIKKWKRLGECKRLMEQAYILYNGDLVLCCVDWERSTVMGNIKEKSLEEIWNGEQYIKVRKRYFEGEIKDILCGKCMIKDEKDFAMG